MQNEHSRSRRWFLGLGAAWSAALVACQSKTAAPPPVEPKALGAAVSPYGSRSKFEKTARFFNKDTKVPLGTFCHRRLTAPFRLCCFE